MSTTRRQLLIRALAAAGVLGGGSAVLYPLWENRARPSRDALGLVLDDERFKQAQIIDLGAAYLKLYPQEADVKLLLDRLNSEDPSHPISKKQAEKNFCDLIQSDYENGRTFLWDHWFASFTEGRACALVSLLYGSKA